MSSLNNIPGLEEAISSGDLDAVTKLYITANKAQQPALLTTIAEQAARKSQVDILDWCCHAGLPLPKDSLNNELYEQACMSRSTGVLDVLVRHGLDLNSNHSEFVGDALGLAAYHGDVDLARLLLGRGGADPDSTWGYQEHEAGVWAVVGPNKSLDILRLMLEHGWTQKGSTAHIAAAETGDMQALKLLVEAENAAEMECADPWWPIPSEGKGEPGTALYRAALNGQEEAVRYLLEKGADPSYKDAKGRSCYWAAKEGGNEKVIALFQGRG
ncbi:ankyrin repeat-containing protein [Xylariaceae sp. FL0594]|nr:ankyrin repeat-containing protein [Xylariaceae sp. FL0594]